MQSPPPALRREGVREISDVFSAPGQVEYPSPVETDACLADSVMGYQSSELSFASRDVSRSVLVWCMGQSSRERTGAKRELAQRAEAGYFSFAAHVTAPPSFATGSLDAMKAQGMQLRREFLSRVGRDSAPTQSTVANRYLPSTWDWAASPQGMDARDPHSSAFPQFPLQRKGKPTAANLPLPPFFDKSTIFVSLCCAPSTPSTVENATSLSTPLPRSAPMMDADGCCRSEGALLFFGGWQLPPDAEKPSLATDKGAASIHAKDKGTRPSK